MTTTVSPDLMQPEDTVYQPAVVRFLAKAVSYLLHPIFIPGLVTFVVLFIHPINRLLIDERRGTMMLIMVFISTAFLPAFSIFLLWRLKFIQTIFMRTQKERIIPFVIAMFFFFWIYYVSRNLEYFPLPLKQFLLGIFLCSASAMFANMYTMISMHGIAVGGLAAFSVIQQFRDMHWQSTWTLVAIVLAGVVCTSRLILQAHKPVDVYAGFFTGLLCQLAAAFMIS